MLESHIGCVSQSVTDQSARHLQYDRDQLLSLYTTADPGVAVVARLSSLELYTVCRLRRPSSRHWCRRTGHAGYPSSLQRDSRFSFRRYRGCRAGRSCHSLPIIRPTGCGAFVLVASGSQSTHVDWLQSRSCRPSLLINVHVERHSALHYAGMSFRCFNIYLLGNKADDLLEVRRDRQIDVMFE